MGEIIVAWILENAPLAHWYVFFLIVLAGLNVPISIDLVAMTAGVIAAKIMPENTLKIFLFLWVGCMLSAYASFLFGRILARYASNSSIFKKVLPENRLAKINKFYGKWGLLALILGRFIPFGMRNTLFISSGVSGSSFRKFIVRDAIASFIWSSTIFTIAIKYSAQKESLAEILLTVTLFVVGLFAVTGIVLFWYKSKSKKADEQT